VAEELSVIVVCAVPPPEPELPISKTSGAEVAPMLLASPEYEAVKLWLPALKEGAVKLTVPEAGKLTVPMSVKPSLKETVPVGVPAGVEVTVAVKVTGDPATGFAGLAVRTTVIAASTVCETVAEAAA
jgi:hypothetical protein